MLKNTLKHFISANFEILHKNENNANYKINFITV